MRFENLTFEKARFPNQIQTSHLAIGNYDFIIYHTGYMNERDFSFWHSHVCYELYFVISGKPNIKIGERIETLKDGDLLLISPGTVHYVEHSSNEKKAFYSLIFELSPIKSGQASNDRRAIEAAEIERILQVVMQNGYILVPTEGKTKDLFNGLFAEISEEIAAKTFGWNISLNTLCLRVLISAIRQIPFVPEVEDIVDEKANLAIRCLDYIRVHYSEDITIESLATDLFISPRHVNRVFQKMFMTNFGDILRTFRLDAAKDLIGSTDMEDREIAKIVGLGTEQTLKKLFFESEKMSLSDYRKTLNP